MFNEDKKLRFIRSYTDNINNSCKCVGLFDMIAPVEERYGKDISLMNTEELEEVVKGMNAVRVNSRETQLSVFKDYVRWCKENGDEVSDDIFKIRISKILVPDSIREKMVSTPLYLQNYLNSFLSKEDDNSSDNIFRCFFWMAYSGMEEADIYSVKKSEVDFYNGMIHHDGKDYFIYREAIPAFKKCVELTSFTVEHPHYSRIAYRERPDSEFLLSTSASEIKRRSIVSNLSNKINKAEKDGFVTLKLSFNRARLSGVFFRMYEREVAGMPVDFSPLAEEHFNSREYHFGNSGMTPRSKKLQLERNYKRDYEQWKIAFFDK